MRTLVPVALCAAGLDCAPRAVPMPDSVAAIEMRTFFGGAPRDGDIQTGPRQAFQCSITHIADGDSFTCSPGGRARLLMVDAPELSQERWGNDARLALRRYMPVASRVTLVTDVQPRDRFGRLLVYAYTPRGTFVNVAMARSGYVTALVIPPNVRYAREIRDAVAEARRARRGLWATSAFRCSPGDHRARRC